MQKNNNLLVAPVLKWVGGKRQLLYHLIQLLPRRITVYCEPFVGGGALLFSRRPQVAYVNDINEELIRVYRVIKDDVEALITSLQGFKNEAGYFYAVRDWDRDRTAYAARPEAEKAARILYLNKTCYNGLFRVNSAGEFNAPFGYYRNPNIVNAPVLRAVSAYLNQATVHLTALDYAAVLKELPAESFVYFDPPYDPVSETANFTGYAKGGFSRAEQIRLRQCCDDLDRRGIKFMLSNAATDFIREQYNAYHITVVQAKRAVNSDGAKRGEVAEVVVRNYE
ncbi:MAG: DNA adenine methylase [Firmicutes bacterium]|nr:DNA adenine methylase [Bacillota bacterium]